MNLLEFAIKMEMEGEGFYRAQAEQNKDGNLYGMFISLAEDEKMHADILRMLGNTNEAVLQYEEALQHCPDFLEATIKLGTQYLQLQQDQLAAKQFNRAVEINDKIVDAYLGLAASQKMAGYVNDALGTISLAAAIVPNSSMLFAETAVLQFQEGFRKNMPVYES